MRLARGALLGTLTLLSACSSTRVPEAPRALAVPTTVLTTTTAVPPIVTAAPVPTRPHVTRASRSRPVGYQRASAAGAVFTDCGSWGSRTRAQSDDCWLPYVTQWSDWSPSKALAVIYCESRGNPWAKNPRSSAAGLFQILHGSVGDGPSNIAQAHAMYARRGWQPWVCG